MEAPVLAFLGLELPCSVSFLFPSASAEQSVASVFSAAKAPAAKAETIADRIKAFRVTFISFPFNDQPVILLFYNTLPGIGNPRKKALNIRYL